MTKQAPVVEKLFFIYGLYCPITEQLRYIGCSKNPNARMLMHIDDPQTSVREWIVSLQSQGMAPVMKILEHTSGDGKELEKQWITKSFAEGHDLLNREHSPERRPDWPRTGRPCKKPEEKIETPKWQFRLPVSEREEIKAAAAKLGEDASAFARRVLLKEARKVNQKEKYINDT